MGNDGLCCFSYAIQTWPGPSSLLEEWNKTPIVFVVSLCCRLGYSPDRGKRSRYIECRVTDNPVFAATMGSLSLPGAKISVYTYGRLIMTTLNSHLPGEIEIITGRELKVCTVNFRS